MITVYVPTFNRAAKLRDALTALRLQTLDRSRFRVVVSDNASTDETPEVVAEFRDLDLVYRRRERNVGLAANWCGAAEFLDGDYLQFLSDDDLLAPFHLELCLRELEARPDVGVFGTGVLWGDGLWERNTTRGDLRLGDRLLDAADRCVHWTSEAWLAAHSIASAVNIMACVFRSEALRGLEPLFDGTVSLVTDRWMMAQVGARTRCVTTPWPTSLLRVHGGNAVHGSGILETEDFAREVARRVLALAESMGLDLPGYWRRYFAEGGSRRSDVAQLLAHAYPTELAEAILKDVPRHGRRLDGWPLPGQVKDAVRVIRARWRRRARLGAS